MSDMKFIRKGTGRPFPKGQFSLEELRSQALPGVVYAPWLTGWRVRLVVRASGSNEGRPVELAHFSGEYRFDVVAGLDPAGRPSFLTVEEHGTRPSGVGLYCFTLDTEGQIAEMSLEQSTHFADDLVADAYVAQWSLVTPPRRRGLRREPALYELSAAYALSSYRAEGRMHLCLGDRVDPVAPVLATR